MSPGHYRVATFSEAATKRVTKKVGQVQKSIELAADEIRTIVMKEVKIAKGNFPTILVGVKKGGSRKHHDGTNIDKEVPGIILFRGKATAVILSPKGIFEYSLATSKSRHEINERPSCNYRAESPELWIFYGEKALRELAKYSQ